jgi:hypothetical protein
MGWKVEQRSLYGENEQADAGIDRTDLNHILLQRFHLESYGSIRTEPFLAHSESAMSIWVICNMSRSQSREQTS